MTDKVISDYLNSEFKEYFFGKALRNKRPNFSAELKTDSG